MKKVETIVEYKVWYARKDDYDGEWQMDKIGVSTGLHGTFGGASGGLARARKEAKKCKAWFNDEHKVVEKQGPSGKLITEIRTTRHDNVIVWIEKFIDGFPTDDIVETEACESEKSEKKKKEPVTA